ncbi:DUF5926 family protein [Nocardioides perillae]|uniref:DUF5926 domain-containing protein n=1 Tax=Nocardioides perillae TaxID=1119534 RepID=A0A7Y9RUP5_9ACTN|nr:DUF5926 family protein [Nocardioides perillae]NYG54290.1 hypothetical protein [Nocardioides perillae]
MGKRQRDRARAATGTSASTTGGAGGASGTEGAVGPRQPCPCGSGKRYKACHGAPGGGTAYVARPFAGLDSECDLVALRELVPAATAPLPLVGEHADRSVRLATLLPGAAPAMVRPDGTVWLGLQVQHAYGDPSRELAAVLLAALAAEPGETVGLATDPGPGPRLQDLVAPGPLDVTVHEGFGYWLDDVEDAGPEAAAALEQADASVHPTAKLASVPSGWWTHVGTKEHLRWVMPHPEDELLDALARLHAAGRDTLVEGSRFVGMFRAHGLLTPVWDLPVGTGAEAVEDPASDFGEALAEALAATEPLTAAERSARAGLQNRQVTIR